MLVNVVLATDIFDPELNGLRKVRWERAFSSDILSHEERNDLRATIVVSCVLLRCCLSRCIVRSFESKVSLSSNPKYYPGPIYVGRLNISSKLQMYLTQCSIGISIENGIDSFLKNCIVPIAMVEWQKIHPTFGTMGKSC